ncbi:WD repeat-containing protein 49 [Rhodotorula kratochvilovae]
MSYTTDDGNLFQSDAQHHQSAERAARAHLLKDRGNPIQLASKPLRVFVRGHKGAEPDAWVAESGFVSGKTKQLFRGHGGPVTSLAFHTSNGRELLISGSWDKSFRVWDVQTKTLLSTTVSHIDFVKTLLVVPVLNILVTGSSDKDVRVWDLGPLDALDIPALVAASSSSSAVVDEPAPPPAKREGAAPPPAVPLRPLPCLCALKGHTRPIEQLAAYAVLKPLPAGLSEDEAEQQPREETGAVALLSADSMGALKVWELRRTDEGVNGELSCEVRDHELGIFDLSLGEDGLWTASADNSVLLSTLDRSSPSSAPVPILRIPHPAQVRALLPLSHAPAALTLALLSGTPVAPYLLTSGADELLRLWDLSLPALDPSPPREASRAWRGVPALGRLEGCTREVEGHAHEVVQLRAYACEGELWVLSASLDGTLRRWRWSELREGRGERLVLVPVEEKQEEKESLLTEEEERELAELMGED